MFGRHSRRSSNPLFVIFRLILSLTMFVVLLAGLYSAYKHFSGLDPLKLDLQTVIYKQRDKIIPLDNLTKPQIPTSKTAFQFLLIADSHNDNSNLRKAINQAKTKFPDLVFIIGLGDYTDVGTVNELNAVKIELDSSTLRYFLVAGDHDLWDSRNRNLSGDTNFKEVFGPTFQSFTYDNFKFLLLDNSDNYAGISKNQQEWIEKELEKAKEEHVKGILVFLHEPLYHPSSDHAMGKVDKNLKSQAESLIFQLKQADVKKVFAGDIHYFSEYDEPVTKIPMVTIGAIVTDRNPEAPRYGVVWVFDDGNVKVEDVQIRTQ